MNPLTAPHPKTSFRTLSRTHQHTNGHGWSGWCFFGLSLLSGLSLEPGNKTQTPSTARLPQPRSEHLPRFPERVPCSIEPVTFYGKQFPECDPATIDADEAIKQDPSAFMWYSPVTDVSWPTGALFPKACVNAPVVTGAPWLISVTLFAAVPVDCSTKSPAVSAITPSSIVTPRDATSSRSRAAT